MTRRVKEWIAKAEGEWNVALREMRVRKNPNYDAICFHAQQCVEKYLKGFLISKEQYIPKTHNLIELTKLCLKESSTFEFQRDILEQLNKYSVLMRYPGEGADKNEARLAVDSLAIFRKFIREFLGCSEEE